MAKTEKEKSETGTERITKILKAQKQVFKDNDPELIVSMVGCVEMAICRNWDKMRQTANIGRRSLGASITITADADKPEVEADISFGFKHKDTIRAKPVDANSPELKFDEGAGSGEPNGE